MLRQPRQRGFIGGGQPPGNDMDLMPFFSPTPYGIYGAVNRLVVDDFFRPVNEMEENIKLSFRKLKGLLKAKGGDLLDMDVPAVFPFQDLNKCPGAFGYHIIKINVDRKHC